MPRSVQWLAGFLILALSFPAFGESLAVTQTPVTVTAKKGETVPISVILKNVLAARPPITLRAELAWTDEAGADQIAVATTTVNVVQSIRLRGYFVPLGVFGYMTGSAKVDGVAVTPRFANGSWVFDFERTLLEGESAALDYSVNVQ